MFNTLAGKFGGFSGGGGGGGHLGSFYTTSNTAFIVPADANFVVVKMFGGTGVGPRSAKISNTHYQYTQGGHTTVKLSGPTIHSNTFFITVDGVGPKDRDAHGQPSSVLGLTSGIPGGALSDPGTAFFWGHNTSGGTVSTAQRLAADGPSPPQAASQHAGIFGGGYVALSAIELVDNSTSQAAPVTAARMTVLQNSIIGLAGGSGSGFNPKGPLHMGGSAGITGQNGGNWVGPVPAPVAPHWPAGAKVNGGLGANTTAVGAARPGGSPYPGGGAESSVAGGVLEGGSVSNRTHAFGAGGHGYFGGGSAGTARFPGGPSYPAIVEFGGSGGGGSNFIISSPSPYYPRISNSANSLYSATFGWNVADTDFDAVKDLHFPSSNPGSELGTSGFAVVKFFGDNPGTFDTDDKAGLYPAIDTWTSGNQANTANASIEGGYISDILLVGGGGSGGQFGEGAGGGGGGYKHIKYLFKNSVSYPITVGLGAIDIDANIPGPNGGPTGPQGGTTLVATSSILGTPNVNIEAHGGGPGFRTNLPPGQAGASTGGGSTGGGGQTAAIKAGFGWEGYPGGDGVNLDPGPGAHASGGGGGAGRQGATVPPSGGTGGNGGDGKVWINGVSYAGGGAGSPKPAYSPPLGAPGGGGWANPSPGDRTHPQKLTTNGTDGLGGGGGGSVLGLWVHTGGAHSPKGGSGVVIIAYSGGQRGTGGTVSTSGGKTYHTFTANGTYSSS